MPTEHRSLAANRKPHNLFYAHEDVCVGKYAVNASAKVSPCRFNILERLVRGGVCLNLCGYDEGGSVKAAVLYI